MQNSFLLQAYQLESFPFERFSALEVDLLKTPAWNFWRSRIGLDEERAKRLIPALIHPSFVHERKSWNLQHHQNLEFLGDAILDAILVAYLVTHFSHHSEGILSKMKVHLVHEAQLAELAEWTGLAPLMLLGKGELLQGGDHKPSILADSFEAVIGQYFLLNGYEETAAWVIRLYLDFEKETKKDFFSLGESQIFDAKGRLQEELLKLSKEIPSYEESEVEGGFSSRVKWGGSILAESTGQNKKAAQKNAALKALEEKKYLSMTENIHRGEK